jgi:hypothetical protein
MIASRVCCGTGQFSRIARRTSAQSDLVVGKPFPQPPRVPGALAVASALRRSRFRFFRDLLMPNVETYFGKVVRTELTFPIIDNSTSVGETAQTQSLAGILVAMKTRDRKIGARHMVHRPSGCSDLNRPPLQSAPSVRMIPGGFAPE